jgi:hypothetical protein
MDFFSKVQEFLGGASEDVASKVEDAQSTISDSVGDPAGAVEEHVQELLGGQGEEKK